MRLTLPTEGRRGLRLSLYESAPERFRACEGALEISLEWEPGFRPDELEAIGRLDGDGRRFRLVDAGSRSATIRVPDSVEPIDEDGRLVVRVAMPERSLGDLGALTGQVLDDRGRPLGGARVTLSTMWAKGCAARTRCRIGQRPTPRDVTGCATSRDGPSAATRWI